MELYDSLLQLLPGQFDDVLVRLGVPPEYVTTAPAPLTTRAIELIRWVDQGGQARHAELARILAQITQPVPRASETSPPDLNRDLELLIAQLLLDRPLPRLPGSTRTLNLDRCYIKLTLRPETAGREREQHFLLRQKREAGDREALEAFTRGERIEVEDALARHTRLVVLGDPGTGKTTLLLHLLKRERDRLEAGEPDRLPLYMPLRELAARLSSGASDSTPLGDLVDALLERGSFLPRAAVHAAVETALSEGRLLVLLDGLDEVPEACREPISRWVEGLLLQLKHRGPGATRASPEGNRSVLTCRVMAWQGPVSQGEAVFEVAPFSDEDIGAFIAHYFGEGRMAHASSLFEKLRNNHSRVRELGRNPLLLGLLCRFYETTNALPQRREELYSEIINSLLRQWDREKFGRRERELRIKAGEKERALETLAWAGFQHPERPLTGGEIKQELEPLGLLDRDREPAALDTIIQELTEVSGLLVELMYQRYTFLHLTVQEYFVALRLSRGDWRAEVLQHASDSRWAEVLLLLAALLEDAGPLLVSLARADAWVSLLEAASRDARSVSGSAWLELWESGSRARLPDRFPPHSALGACLRGRLEERSGNQVDAFMEVERMAGAETLRRLYGKVLAEDVRLWREEGRRVDPVAMYVALSHLERWVSRERPGTDEMEDWLRAWRGPDLEAGELVEVPEGTFTMGSDELPGEHPPHSVHVPAFHLGRYPVTNEAYAVYDLSHFEAVKRRRRDFSGLGQPVIDVSWYDAWVYARWRGGRLPSEAEWEYAARGPEGRRYPWGDAQPTPRLANFDRKVGRTTPVGSYPKGVSWCGAEDLAGNVWEWCEDHPRDSYAGAPDDGSAWMSHEGLAHRVIRGGGWGNDAVRLRGACRFRRRPWAWFDYLGFRVVLVCRVPGGRPRPGPSAVEH